MTLFFASHSLSQELFKLKRIDMDMHSLNHVFSKSCDDAKQCRAVGVGGAGEAHFLVKASPT